jgi:hypothetical protein
MAGVRHRFFSHVLPIPFRSRSRADIRQTIPVSGSLLGSPGAFAEMSVEVCSFGSSFDS